MLYNSSRFFSLLTLSSLWRQRGEVERGDSKDQVVLNCGILNCCSCRLDSKVSGILLIFLYTRTCARHFDNASFC
jgi:hypothetical protein